MHLNVRHVQPKDAEDILRIHREAVEDGNSFVQEIEEFKATVDTKRQQIDRVLNSQSSCIIVAELDQKVVGWLSLSGYELKKLSHVAMLGMAVDREYRGKQIGFSMVTFAIKWAKSSQTLRRLALAVFESNTAAVSLYKKCRFNVEGVEQNEIRLADGRFINQIIMAITW